MKATIMVEMNQEEYEEYQFLIRNKHLIATETHDILEYLDKEGYKLTSRKPFYNPCPAANDPLGRPEGERFIYKKDNMMVSVEVYK